MPQTPLVQFKLEKLKDFQEVFKNGKKFKTHTSQIVFYIEKKENQHCQVRLGLIALKKIVGKKAVTRNKAKRRFRNGFLEHLRQISLPAGYCLKMVALTNKNTVSQKWEFILLDIQKAMSYIKTQIHALGQEISHEIPQV